MLNGEAIRTSADFWNQRLSWSHKFTDEREYSFIGKSKNRFFWQFRVCQSQSQASLSGSSIGDAKYLVELWSRTKVTFFGLHALLVLTPSFMYYSKIKLKNSFTSRSWHMGRSYVHEIDQYSNVHCSNNAGSTVTMMRTRLTNSPLDWAIVLILNCIPVNSHLLQHLRHESIASLSNWRKRTHYIWRHSYLTVAKSSVV